MNDEEEFEEAERAANEWWGADDQPFDPRYPTGEKGIFVMGWIACRRKQAKENNRSQRSRE